MEKLLKRRLQGKSLISYYYNLIPSDVLFFWNSQDDCQRNIFIDLSLNTFWGFFVFLVTLFLWNHFNVLVYVNLSYKRFV